MANSSSVVLMRMRGRRRLRRARGDISRASCAWKLVGSITKSSLFSALNVLKFVIFPSDDFVVVVVGGGAVGKSMLFSCGVDCGDGC